MYPPEMVAPMNKDLTDYGFQGLDTADDVTNAFTDMKGTALLVINSVCGCAAGNARPGAKMSVTGDKKPDQMYTVFAGVNKDATNKAREFMLPYPPSSPSIGLFKDGQLVHFLERHHIEGRSAEIIAQNLRMAFDRFC